MAQRIVRVVMEQDLVLLLQETAVYLWKDWPKDMEAVSLGDGGFSLRGVCPHTPACGNSVFVTKSHIGSPNAEMSGNVWFNRTIAIMQCQGCQKYILAIVRFPQNSQVGREYVLHYPMGVPDDSVAPEIPTHIGEDFSEAIRCLSVNAYNAAAEMCRRSLEASCIHLGIPKGMRDLEDMIDSLEAQRKITPHMKEVAHKIRLGGNRGAHPPEADVLEAMAAAAANGMEVPGPVIIIEEDHAKAIVEFTRQFFHHVYVVPQQLGKYDFTKPKVPKS
jgi:hypothetical protein